MGYFDWGFSASGDDSQLIDRIVSYYCDIWELVDYDEYGFDSTADQIKEDVDGGYDPELRFIESESESEYLTRVQSDPYGSERELFDFLNALFGPVQLTGYWRGTDSIRRREYFYESEYDFKKLRQVISYGINGVKKKVYYPFRYAAPREDTVRILAMRSADEGNTELTALLLELLNKIQLGMIPNEEQKSENLKADRRELQGEKSALKSKISNSWRTLSPEWREALLERCEACEDERSLEWLSEKYSCAKKMSYTYYLSDSDNAVLLKALLDPSDEGAFDKLQARYRVKAEKMRAIQNKAEREKLKDKMLIWHAQREKERLAEEIRSLEAKLDAVLEKLKEYKDIPLVGIEVDTAKGTGVISKQNGAKISVTIGTETTLYLLHKKCPKRPRFKNDEQIVEQLSAKYDLDVERKRMETKLAELRRKLNGMD